MARAVDPVGTAAGGWDTVRGRERQLQSDNGSGGPVEETPVDIIVVDDSPTQVEYLRRILLDAGYTVRTASGAEACLGSCRTSPPALILSDLVMPGISGLELVRAVRNDRELCDIPVILLTADHDPEHVIDALRAGAANYVSKPFVPEVLIQRIGWTLEAHGYARSPTPIPSGPGLFATLRSALEDAATRARELERSRAALAAAIRQRDELVAVVAHDLRTPLQVLQGHASLAARDGTGRILAGLAEVVNDQTATMVRLIDDLVDATQAESGVLQVQPQPIDLVKVIASCVVAMRHRWPNHPMTADGPASAMIHADGRRLAQVVTNLLDNAAKYSDAGSPIAVTVIERSDAVQVSIADRGIGIPKAQRQVIFERHGRTDAGRAKASGSGLGLFICRELIHLHGGTVTVEDNPPTGSRFVVTLPRDSGATRSG